MSFRLVLLVPLVVATAHAQTQERAETLANTLDQYASREEPRLGLDSRIHAAQRLRAVAPAAALSLLEKCIPQVRQLDPPSYSTYRFLVAYALLDWDAAESLGTRLADAEWSYTALIEVSKRQGNYPRAARLIREAMAHGQYNLSAISAALEAIQQEQPDLAQTLLRERIGAFPTEEATYVTVHALLNDLSGLVPLPPELAKDALRKIFQAIDRPGFSDGADYEESASFNLHGNQIPTDTAYESALLPSAACLSAFDPEAFRHREPTLPGWRAALHDFSPDDLRAIIHTSRVRRDKGMAAPSQRVRTAAPPRPDYAHMTYEEVVRAAQDLTDGRQVRVLLDLARRADLDPQQRLNAYHEALRAVPPVQADGSVSSRLAMEVPYSLMSIIFDRVVADHIDEILPIAARQWMETLDATSRLRGRSLNSLIDSGQMSRDYSRLGEILDQRKVRLDNPSPSVRAREVLRAIDNLPMEQVDFSLRDSHGKSHSLAELRGKIVLLDFWASWCGPCIKEIPLIKELHADLGGKGVVVLGVDDESAATVRGFEQKNALPYTTLIDADRKLHDRLGIEGIPACIVIDRNGVVVDRVPYPHAKTDFLTVLRQAGLDRSEGKEQQP